MQSPCLCFQPHADHDLATPRLSAHAATVRPCWEASYGKSARAAPTLVDQPAVLVAEGIVPGGRSSCDQVSQEFLGLRALGVPSDHYFVSKVRAGARPSVLPMCAIQITASWTLASQSHGGLPLRKVLRLCHVLVLFRNVRERQRLAELTCHHAAHG